MEQQATPIDTGTQPAERPTFLTVLCILSFIGSGLWALMSLIGIFASGWLMSFMGNFMGEAVQQAQENGELNGMDAERAQHVMNMFAGMGTGLLIIVCIISLILGGLSLWGAISMWGLKKSGFILYVIPNGLVFLANLISFNVVGILVNGGFIAMYAVNYKHLKN